MEDLQIHKACSKRILEWMVFSKNGTKRSFMDRKKIEASIVPLAIDWWLIGDERQEEEQETLGGLELLLFLNESCKKEGKVKWIFLV